MSTLQSEAGWGGSPGRVYGYANPAAPAATKGERRVGEQLGQDFVVNKQRVAG